ncbi:hypothetical protein BU14_0240s0021 [Porphyra umbilicalis]|uniref:Uncharacterized protein n=1 Tax=Porphyra umbilicalis TaxID=2786 RepID=A0A1X6P3X5_PORUM|nr:hypothetical protein BU14_0240s0021 [Porphyra umbilicalis]|eukprot:OSX75343.1 hypothetical protein BU14_0240s0021 [Porphyra umbilicalis]
MVAALTIAGGAYCAYALYAVTFPMDLLRARARPPASCPTPVSAALTRLGVYASEQEADDAAAAAGVTVPGGVVAGRAMRMKRLPQLLESGSRLVSSDRADGTLLDLVDQDMRHWAAKQRGDGGGTFGANDADDLAAAAAAEAAGGLGDRTTWLSGLGHTRRRVMEDGLRTWAQPLAGGAAGDAAADSLDEMLFDVMTEEEAGAWGASGKQSAWLFDGGEGGGGRSRSTRAGGRGGGTGRGGGGRGRGGGGGRAAAERRRQVTTAMETGVPICAFASVA